MEFYQIVKAIGVLAWIGVNRIRDVCGLNYRPEPRTQLPETAETANGREARGVGCCYIDCRGKYRGERLVR
jgi:hypothetical protein